MARRSVAAPQPHKVTIVKLPETLQGNTRPPAELLTLLFRLTFKRPETLFHYLAEQVLGTRSP